MTRAELRGMANSVKMKKAKSKSDYRLSLIANWNMYIDSNNKIFNMKLKEYTDAKQALCDKFTELVHMQNEILKDIQALKQLLNYKKTPFEKIPSGCRTPKLIPLPNPMDDVYFNGQIVFPDAAFFIENGQLTAETGLILSKVAYNRAPYEGPDSIVKPVNLLTQQR